MLLKLTHSFLLLYSPPPCIPFPPSFPHLSSCLWVIHKTSLASPFPILFITSSYIFCPYHLCFLFPVPFPDSTPTPSPLMTLHVMSISVNLFLFWLFAQFIFGFGFFLGSVVDSCEFVVILLFIFLIIFFSLNKSL